MNRLLARFLLSPTARPLRFAGTGSTAGATQLVLLRGFTRAGWPEVPADALAFLLAAQLNFLLSSAFTWRDRAPAGSLPGRWLLFHVSIALGAALNLLTFTALHRVIGPLPASAAGIITGALGNYLTGDRVVFRPGRAIAITERNRAA